ncbi:vanadium-dependent haloperoxidase [Allohahella marinimesophila]|uniref:Vanadium-dependent haloperoxidase n=1 Tax=Allohahella marinimesophila TaxID=1054972 RepID=A0ABP7P8A1_9GAMM
MSFSLKKHCLALAIGLAILPMLSACSDDDKEKTTLRAEREPFNEGLSLVSQWNELGLAGIRESGARPTVTTRQLFILSSAMYDAWSAFDDVAVPYALDPTLKAEQAFTEDNRARAVSQAAYQVLVRQFPNYEASTGNFSEYMQRLGYPVLTAGTADTPDGIGFLAAEAALAKRAADGSNAAANYADTPVSGYATPTYVARNSANPDAVNGINGVNYDPNIWQPLRVPTGTTKDAEGHPVVDVNDPASFNEQKFLTPHWGAVTPFAMASGDEFRPGPPPVLNDFSPYTDGQGDLTTNDAAFREQFQEVLTINGTLTDYERASAEFWADGPRTEAPPGHWNQLAHGVSGRDNNSVEEDVKMFFALNAALLDAGIAAWDAKREYDSPRPAAAIPYLYKDQIVTAYVIGEGVQQIPGQDWRPYQNPTFVTPPFPEYVSGHSTFSASAAEVLTRFTGSPTFYDGTTVTVQDINGDDKPDMLGQFVVGVNTLVYDSGPSEELVLRWPTFKDAANEASRSRIYGGIHIQDGDLRARVMGEQIGTKAYELAERFWTGDTSVR